MAWPFDSQEGTKKEPNYSVEVIRIRRIRMGFVIKTARLRLAITLTLACLSMHDQTWKTESWNF